MSGGVPRTMGSNMPFKPLNPGGKHKFDGSKAFKRERGEIAANKAEELAGQKKSDKQAERDAAKAESEAAKAHAAKMKARTVKSNATRAENVAKAKAQTLGYNDTHRDQLGRGSYVELLKFHENEQTNRNRAQHRKQVKAGYRPANAGVKPKTPAAKAAPAVKPVNRNVSRIQN